MDLFGDVRKRPVRPLWLSSESRLLSDIPPVLTPAERDAMTNGSNGSNGQSTYNRNGYGQNGSGPNGHTPQDPAAMRTWSTRSTRPPRPGPTRLPRRSLAPR